MGCCNLEPFVIGYKTLSNGKIIHTMQCPKCKSIWEEEVSVLPSGEAGGKSEGA